MKLDFRAIRQPSLEITLLDADETTINVLMPTEGMYERLLTMAKELREIANSKDIGAINKCYDFMAELISRNTQKITITGDELRVKYGIDFMLLLELENAYMQFVAEATGAKN